MQFNLYQVRAYARNIASFCLFFFLHISCLSALYAQGAASSVNYSDVSLDIALPVGQPSASVTAVDLGLTSNGRKLFWADRNIGAANINENGIFYAWGETRTNTVFTVAENYGNRIYIFKSRHSAHLGITAGTYFLIKYWNNPSYPADLYGFPNHANDGLHVLQPEDDAAHVIWGGDWRMPTKAEIDSLLTCTHSNFTNNSGVVISGRGSYSSNQIKVPAAGHMNEFNHRENGAESNFWSSTLYEEGGRDVNSYNAYAYRCRKVGLIFQRTEYDQTYEMRYDGFPVRPVIEARKIKINYTEDGNPCSSSEEKNIEYPKGASFTLSAISATCKQFVRWEKYVNGSVVETYSSINPTVTISDDATYTAVFETIKYQISSFVIEQETNFEQGGEVVGAAEYDCGSSPSLTANPDDCHTFVKWQKKTDEIWQDIPGATNATINVTVDADAEYQAVFSLKTASITLTSDGHGTVEFDD